jgi:non-ribosomal peptide synthetase component F
MFILQNTPEQEGLSLGELRVDELEVDHGAAKFDLTLEVLEKPGGHELLLEYDTALFQVSTALRIVDHFDRLLAAAVAAPEEPISSLPMLADDERARLVDDWNDTRADYPGELLLHELFDRQVELTPDRPAAIFDHDELTYRDLRRPRRSSPQPGHPRRFHRWHHPHPRPRCRHLRC